MVSLIVALYNEEKRMGARYPLLIEFLSALKEPWELILVDDGSRDGTLEALRALSRGEDRVRILHSQRNLGQGCALKLGVLASRGDVVLYTDADLPVPLSFCKTLIERVRVGHDIAFASRWIYGSKIGVPQPGLRRTLGKAYYWIIHKLILPDVHDTNCGMKAYRGDAARMIFGFIHSRRWAFNVEHLWLCRQMGFRYLEVPTEWSHQDHSKVRLFRDCLFTLYEILRIKFRQILGLYPCLKPGH